MALTITCTQHIGRRALQQDTLWNGSAIYQEQDLPVQETPISENACVTVAVADGVSSSPSAHLASKKVIEALRMEVRQGTRFDGRLLRRVHGHLCDALAKGSTFGSATTLTVAQVQGERCKILSVGDSRAYLIDANGHWRQLSRDSTILNDLIDDGEADYETEYASLYNMLESCLVADDEETEFMIHASESNLLEGETLLLCTDGVHGVLGDKPLHALYEPSLRGSEQVERWRQAILDAGAWDNFSLLLVRRSI